MLGANFPAGVRMSHDLPTPSVRRTCAARRAAFVAHLRAAGAPEATAILVPAGAAPPRTYAYNTYAFRASSHFLHLVGCPLEGAWLVLGVDGEAALYAEPPADDDALWHGPSPSVAEWSEALGLPLRPLDQLPRALSPHQVGLIRSPDAATGYRADQLLAAQGGPDVALNALAADAIIAGRMVHDDAAIAELRAAAALTVEAHRVGMAFTRPDRPVPAVAAAMLQVFAAEGLTTSYLPIVSTRGEVLHDKAPSGICRAGDLLLADVGAESKAGYAADVTRTWPVSGKFSATQQAIYEAVLAAELAAIAAVRPGARYRDIHLEGARTLTRGLVDLGIFRGDVDGLVEDGVHAMFFPHGIGHLLGLDVHDMEDLGDRAGYAPERKRATKFGLRYLRLDRDLEAGMAVTIEPGFYQVPAILSDPQLMAVAADRLVWSRLADFSDVRGIRIEDDVLVTMAGSEVLTEAAPKTVAAVEQMMRGGV
jgi:Xaa-Pro aminopeptidase